MKAEQQHSVEDWDSIIMSPLQNEGRREDFDSTIFASCGVRNSLHSSVKDGSEASTFCHEILNLQDFS